MSTILGNPITLGGGNGNELIVTAPSGSTVTATKGSVTKTATENGTFYVAAAGVKPTESPMPVYKDWYLGSDGYFMQNAQKIGAFLVMLLITTVTKHL